ncbi:ABC transporter ATP-binding protein [Staphylococcus sp. ACRSN]|uniref:ATP-binding cassette domain-containing protein n=1 Tax=Staphylococcus sp. ACRSN TaxID=2918214 RepID=UPI001EF36A50|nr:ABC transporter ATP-binding protein [Staphylococcus sp. ACRSN]MCG7340273.1 ABC transporter ATP-binding protein [Staphylococcus sp. ACRSN]
MEHAIKVKNISKYFNKQKRIIDNLSFTIPKHSITLVKGQNGVGKSITLKLLAKLIPPTKGQIDCTYTISYTPDAFPKNIKLTVDAYLNYMLQLHKNKTNNLNNEDLNGLIDRFNLNSYRYTPLTQLSKGSLQKVNIIQCLLSNADILIFDEPFSGLDYSTEHAFINYLSSLATNKTIILTAHNHTVENSIVTHVLDLNSKQLGAVQAKGHFKLKQISILNRDIAFPDEVQQFVYSKTNSDNNVIVINVLKTESNQLLKSLINNNYEIIEVKEL